MRKVTLTACCVLFTALIYAQQVFFLYVQSETRQPFYAKLNGRLHSSTAAGYLVIPRLVSGEYTLQVGFPKSEKPELNFPCKVAGNDLGFSLKSFGDKGLGLFNLRDFTVIMPAGAAAKQEGNSQYSDLLAQVVKDPSVKNVSVEKTEIKPPADTSRKTSPPAEPVKPAVPAVETPPVPEKQPEKTAAVPDTPMVKIEQPSIKAGPPQPPQPPPPAESRVTRLFSMAGKEGTDAVYVITTGAVSDTVRLFIPELKTPVPAVQPPPVKEPEPIKQEPPVPVKEPVPEKQDTLKTAAAPPKKEPEAKFLDFEAKKPLPDTVKATAPDTATAAPPPSKLIMYNTGCAKIAGEEDFIKLRKNMAGERTDDDMVATARKAFKQRCYLLKHIRLLAPLLTTDEGRYQLFDAAYAYTYDTEEYETLGGLLTDAYYVNRFKAMIRK